MTDRIVRVVMRGEIGDLVTKAGAAGRAIGASAEKMTNASAESVKYRRGLSALGDTAGKAGLVAAVGVGAIVAASANFEQSMSRVQAATHASASTMDDLREAAIVAGRDTVFSASEAADAITAMSKAGVQAGDILHGGLTGALSLASAGELDVAQAADIAATAMNQFGLSGKDIPHIADLLAAGAGKAQGEVTDMADALSYVGPVAHQMGISIEETTGTIAELASQGIVGQRAGTGLRGMLTALTSPSKQASNEMKNLGIQLYDANGKFVGLDGVAGQLHDTMANLTAEERDQALGRIFGNEQITAARILYAGGAADVQKWTKAVYDQGYAADTAAIKLDNLKGDLEQLKGSLETAAIGAGSGSQGPLRELVQDVTGAVNAFNKLPPAAQSTTTALLGITAVTGGALWFGSRVIRGIADTRKSLEALNVTGARSKTVLSGIGKGFQLVGILETLSLLDAGIDKLFQTDLNETDLGRSLDALAQGRVTGEIKDKFGSDLDGLKQQLIDATGAMENFGDVGGKIGHILGHVPIAGGFLSGPVGDSIENVKKLDEALAGMVESGRQGEAAAIFDQIAATATEAGVSTKDLNGLFGQYRIAAKNATGETTGLAAAQTAGSTAAAQAAQEQLQMAKAIEKSRKAARETAHQFVGLGDSVNDTKVSLRGWLKDMEKQAAALRDFTKNTQTAARKGLREGLIKELEKAGPEGALRMKQLADGTEAEIKRANHAWRLQQQAVRDYVNTVAGVPPSATTDLRLSGEAAALATLRRINREIHNIPPRWQTDYYVIQHNSASKPKILPGNPGGIADGGTVPHAAAGWTVTGQRDPYGDKVLAYLAPGEEVITNRHGEADRFRADRAAGRIPAYADGSVAMPSAMSLPVSAGGTGYGRGSAAASGSELLGHRADREAVLWALRTALSELPILRAPKDLSMLAAVS